MNNDLIIADVSEWQGQIDWSAYVRAGNPIAIVRAYNGMRADEWFDPASARSNREEFWGAGGSGLGIYAFAVSDTAYPIEAQAQAYCSLVGSLRTGQEWPILDMEQAPAAYTDMSGVAAAWRGIVQAQLKEEPWLYTDLSFYRQHNLAAAGFSPQRTIIADYSPTEPDSPAHGLWQFSNSYGPMPGISAAHDANLYHGTAAQLLALVGGAAVVVPPPSVLVPFPGAGAFVLGQSNPNVTLLGRWLIDRGYGRFYQVGPGPVLGEHDVEACRQFQLDQGWTGTDANGYPGPVTWERLQNPDTRPVPHPLVPFPGVGAFVLGRSDPNVTLLGQWLVNKGYGRFYEVGPGPVMGQADVNACGQFQRDQGWTGADANGYPGPVTWLRLQQ